MTQIEIRKKCYNYQLIRGSCSSTGVLLPRCIATDGSWIRPLFQEPMRGIGLLLFWKIDTSLTERNKLWIPRYSCSFTSQEEQLGTREIFNKMVELLYTCCSTVEIETRVEFDVIRFSKQGILSFWGRRGDDTTREKSQKIIDDVLNLAEQYFYFISTSKTFVSLPASASSELAQRIR